MIKKFLHNCTSPETAHITEDYPYGFVLRCIRREWLEFKPNKGFRFVTQTSNPKRVGTVWNAPKASTYTFCAVMYLDENDHVQWAAFSEFSSIKQCENFQTQYHPEGEAKACLEKWLITKRVYEARRAA